MQYFRHIRSQQFKLLNMKTELNNPIKMLDFIQNLYKKYKVLNKISQNESLQFQRQVVTLLVDSKENVDSKTLKNILQQINIEGLVLDILAKVINRNPFKNQFQLNRNLATITQNVKKQQEELQKKQKILQRKQQKIKNTQDSIMLNIKQKINILENQSLQKLIKKENQIKKSITALINQLKSKEKIVLEKYQSIKQNAQILAQIEIKQKSLNQKLKIIQKRQKQLKTKDNESQIVKKNTQINQLKSNIQKLQQSLKESNKRYKNLEMAYKKLKNTKIQQQNSQKKFPKLQINSNGNELDKLQLSQIHQAQKNNDCQQLINFMDLQEVNTKMQKIKKVFVVNDKHSQANQIKKIKQLLNLNQPKSIESSLSQEQDSSKDEQEIMPHCLQPIKVPPHNNIDNFIKNIEEIPLDLDSDKLSFVQQNKLGKLIDLSYQLNTPQKACQILLQRILQLIEQSPHYMQIIKYLSQAKITDYLQHIYLCHQTNPDIIETTTLILSRIKLKDYQLKLNNSFAKALKIRMKIENKSSFLYGNINFILN